MDLRAAEDPLVRDKPVNAKALPALRPKPLGHQRALLTPQRQPSLHVPGAGVRDDAEAVAGKCRSIMRFNWMTGY